MSMLLNSFMILCFLGVARVYATSLTNNEDVGDGILSATPDSITSNGNTFSWADMNGDGNSNDAVNAGLNLAAYNLTRQADGIGFKLNLNDGTSDGAISWGGVSGGQLTTFRDSFNPTGPIAITGATDIACQAIDTHNPGDGQAGAIGVTQTGGFAATNVYTYNGNAGGAGTVTFTGGGPAAGAFNVSGTIDTHGLIAGSVIIRGYGVVTIGGGGIASYETGDGGDGKSVAITNIGAGGVTVAGTIQNRDTGGSSGGTQPNNVKIVSDGNISVADIDTHTGNSLGGAWVVHNSGAITLTAGGSVVAGTLKTYMIGSDATYSRNAGAVTVTAGGAVQLESLDTHNVQNNSSRYAGDVQVTAGGDIVITGTNLDLSSPYGGDRRGSLWLGNAGSGGTVTLGVSTNPGVTKLDLDKLEYIRFDSDVGQSFIYSSITNFVTGGTNTQLRVERDGELVYYTVKNGANAALLATDNGVYPIQSLEGGLGYLKPIPSGTFMTIR